MWTASGSRLVYFPIVALAFGLLLVLIWPKQQGQAPDLKFVCATNVAGTNMIELEITSHSARWVHVEIPPSGLTNVDSIHNAVFPKESIVVQVPVSWTNHQGRLLVKYTEEESHLLDTLMDPLSLFRRKRASVFSGEKARFLLTEDLGPKIRERQP